MAQDQRTVFTHHVSLLEAYKPLDLKSLFPIYLLTFKMHSQYHFTQKNICQVFQNKNNVKTQFVFDHPNMSLTQRILYIIFWTNAQTNSMLIQITQQLLSIDLAGSHIQIAMGNISLPVHLRKFCNETKLNLQCIIMSNTFMVTLYKINAN